MLIGHKKQWEFLEKKFELNQLSHAYLFAGQKEIGKKTFAIEFAKFVSCIGGGKKPCQKCVNCLMIEKNTFPDFKIIIKKEDKTEIEISQIREAQNFLSYKSYYGSFKIMVIDDAENMNQEAQSCFLKTLEEPKGKTLIILVTSKPDMMMGTIASRCQTIKFFRPKDLSENPERLKIEREILSELSPVFNSNLAEKFKYVKALDLNKRNISDILEVIQKYFRNLLLAEVGIGKTPVTAKKYQGKKIKEILNLSEEINNKLIFTNANPKLALEILLMEI